MKSACCNIQIEYGQDALFTKQYEYFVHGYAKCPKCQKKCEFEAYFDNDKNIGPIPKYEIPK